MHYKIAQTKTKFISQDMNSKQNFPNASLATKEIQNNCFFNGLVDSFFSFVNWSFYPYSLAIQFFFLRLYCDVRETSSRG